MPVVLTRTPRRRGCGLPRATSPSVRLGSFVLSRSVRGRLLRALLSATLVCPVFAAALPAAAAPARPPATIFSSDFTSGLSDYRYTTHANRIKVVNDPVLGASRKVLRFRVRKADTGPTRNPRAQIETAYNFTHGQDRYFGFSVYFPSGFPTRLPSRSWVALGSQAYGPPYDGAGGMTLRVQETNGRAELRWQRNETYDWDIAWRGPEIEDVRSRWIDFIQRIRLHRNPRVGFVELWMNTGGGWKSQKLKGRNRLYMRTYDSANGGGANNSRLSLYHDRRIRGPLTIYHGPHRIAEAGGGGFDAVAPRSYRNR